jgi:hypothetical protein
VCAIIVIALFWAAMMTKLVYEKVILEYRRRETVDYSILFRDDGLRDYSEMQIFLQDTYLGFTKTVIHEVEGGGRSIRGETSLNVKTPIVSGVFRMKSTINVAPDKKLQDFVLEISLPLEGADALRVAGKAVGDKLVVDSPDLGYHEEVPLANAMISSGISPFADVVSMRVGNEWEMGLFDPLTRRIQNVKVRVVEQEEVTWRDQQETVFHLECCDARGGVLATAMVDRYGRVLKQKVEMFGLTLEMRRRD